MYYRYGSERFSSRQRRQTCPFSHHIVREDMYEVHRTTCSVLLFLSFLGLYLKIFCIYR